MDFHEIQSVDVSKYVAVHFVFFFQNRTTNSKLWPFWFKQYLLDGHFNNVAQECFQ